VSGTIPTIPDGRTLRVRQCKQSPPDCGNALRVDTLIFGVLLYAAWAVFKGSSRVLILWLFVAGLLATLFVFNHHMTDPLPLNF
jgi:hypothetical protein